MKKLLLLSLICTLPALAMQVPKRKREEPSNESSIVFHDLSAIEPFSIRAYSGQKEAGYIKFGAYPYGYNIGHLNYIQVHKAFRGKGIGYQLFERAIFALKKKGFKRIEWEAVSLDSVAIRDLEQIYLAFVRQLREKLEFDFIKDKSIAIDECEMIPMRLILK